MNKKINLFILIYNKKELVWQRMYIKIIFKNKRNVYGDEIE